MNTYVYIHKYTFIHIIVEITPVYSSQILHITLGAREKVPLNPKSQTLNPKSKTLNPEFGSPHIGPVRLEGCELVPKEARV